MPLTAKLLAEWHPTKNVLDVNKMSAQSNKNAWWVCSFGHEWKSRIQRRTLGDGCPICSGKKILSGFNDLATKRPDLAKEWSDRNPFSSSEVAAASHLEAWWVCSIGHEWKRKIVDRYNGNGCPICVNKVVLEGFNDLATTHPEIASSWSSRNDISPSEVVAGSSKYAWWSCPKGHDWWMTIKNRARGQKCSVCANKQIVIGYNDLASTHLHLAKEWSPNNTLDILSVTGGSNKLALWVCEKGHQWEAKIVSRGKHGCPVCAEQKTVSGINDLRTRFPLIAKEWSDSNDVSVDTINPGTHTQYFWVCSKGHEWKSSPASRTRRNSGCTVCKGQVVVTGFNGVATKRPHLINEWSDQNTHSPFGLSAGSSKRVIWECENGHTWDTNLGDRTHYKTGCPSCGSSQAEKEISDWLESLNVEVVRKDRKSIAPLELDIYLPEYKVAIEYNGVYWHSEAVGKDSEYHENKFLKCQEADIRLIQVWEDDWLRVPHIVKSMILHRLGMNFGTSVGARKTSIVDISMDQAKDFLDNNHIQGFVRGTYYIGLSYNSEVVAVLVATKTRKQTVIDRYATSVKVPGGFTKLLKELIARSDNGDKIVTFADREISNGELYTRTGFREDKILLPDYKYVVNGRRKHKFGYRVDKFKRDENLAFVENATEKQLADLNNLPRVWDSGKIRYVLDVVK